jgi:C_GCAxxG_C_C family probable redox protein
MKDTKAEKARGYFDQGFNCAQAVFVAFAEEMGLDQATALRLSSSFGGGMGGLREVCGAVSGMFMVMGMLKGYDRPDDPEAKKRHYQKLQQMAAQMSEQHGTLICRDLLRQSQIKAAPVPAERGAAYYAKRPCARYVETCATLLEDALAEG